jgi:hypothetical protein
MADTRATIPPVTQTLAQRCPRSSGTLPAISLEWVSAINGMRNRIHSSSPMMLVSQRPNPSVKGTSTSGLRPLAAAPYVER